MFFILSVVPISGSGSNPVDNRNLLQPPRPLKNEEEKRIENFSDETNYFIEILKKYRTWCTNNLPVKHPLFQYLEEEFQMLLKLKS